MKSSIRRKLFIVTSLFVLFGLVSLYVYVGKKVKPELTIVGHIHNDNGDLQPPPSQKFRGISATESDGKDGRPETEEARVSDTFPTAILEKEQHLPIKSQVDYLHRIKSNTGTLARLASEFVDHDLLSTCPSDSVMLNKTLQEAAPLHDDCPDLFIIGVRKGGTTAMLQYLSKHADFEGALIRRERQIGESSYFTKFYLSKSWEWYLSLFPPGVRSGESTVSYFTDCSIPKRIWENCGNHPKIVLLLRNPQDRYESNFIMRIYGPSYKTYKTDTDIKGILRNEYRSLTSKLLKKAVTVRGIKSVEWLRANWAKLRCLYGAGCMLFEGLYYVHLMNWLCNFPSENILILNSEEYYRDTPYAVSQVMEFLGLQPVSEEFLRNITSKAYNAGHHDDHLAHHRLDADDKRMLNEVYHDSNAATLKLLNWNQTEW